MRPEVYGAISLACRESHKASNVLYKNTREGKKRLRKHQEKVKKHIARAVRYDNG